MLFPNQWIVTSFSWFYDGIDRYIIFSHAERNGFPRQYLRNKESLSRSRMPAKSRWSSESIASFIEQY